MAEALDLLPGTRKERHCSVPMLLYSGEDREDTGCSPGGLSLPHYTVLEQWWWTHRASTAMRNELVTLKFYIGGVPLQQPIMDQDRTTDEVPDTSKGIRWAAAVAIAENDRKIKLVKLGDSFVLLQPLSLSSLLPSPPLLLAMIWLCCCELSLSWWTILLAFTPTKVLKTLHP